MWDVPGATMVCCDSDGSCVDGSDAFCFPPPYNAVVYCTHDSIERAEELGGVLCPRDFSPLGTPLPTQLAALASCMADKDRITPAETRDLCGPAMEMCEKTSGCTDELRAASMSGDGSERTSTGSAKFFAVANCLEMHSDMKIPPKCRRAGVLESQRECCECHEYTCSPAPPTPVDTPACR